jgi:hypothetical protein
MEYILWIDDIKNPRYMTLHKSIFTGNEIVVWARDIEQAQFYVLMYGLPQEMYLDHDLGEVDTIMSFLKWLKDQCDWPPPYQIISANPIGAQNIQSFMDSWVKTKAEER